MSNTKQFVYKTPGGVLDTTQRTTTFIIEAPSTLSDSYYNTDSENELVWNITSNSSTSYATTSGAANGTSNSRYLSNGSSGKTNLLTFQKSITDPREAFNSDLPVSKCKVTITGSYRTDLFIGGGGGSDYDITTFPHTFSAAFKYDQGDGTTNSHTITRQLTTGTASDYLGSPGLRFNNPLDGNANTSVSPNNVSFISQGSSVTGGAKTQHTLPKATLQVTNPSSGGWGSFNYRFYGEVNNPVDALGPDIFFQGTKEVSWEGNLYNINGSDGDDAVAMATTASITAIPNQVHYAEASLSSAFTIAEDSINLKIAPATTMSSASSVAITTLFKLGDTLTLSSQAILITSTANLALASSSLSSAFTIADTTTLKVGPESGFVIASVFSTSQLGGMKYDVTGDYTWNSLSNNPFVESGYVKGGYTDDAEYEWDDLLNALGDADATWDTWTYGTWLGDETGWDDWPFDAWNSPLTFANEFTQADTTAILKVGGTSSLSSAFTITEDAALNKNATASLSSTFTISGTGAGVISVTPTLSSAFTLAVLDVDFLENILQSELPITAAFTTSFTGSIKYAPEIAISSAMTFSLGIIKLILGIDETPASIFSASFTGNIKYALDETLTLSVLASKVSVGLLLTQADPYRIITVDAETRTFVVPAESRSTVVQEENRLNIISSETRLENVLEETRVHKLKIPGLTNIYSTPRVRSET